MLFLVKKSSYACTQRLSAAKTSAARVALEQRRAHKRQRHHDPNIQ